MFRLLRYFTVFSAAAIFTVASVLVYQYRHNAVTDVVASAEGRNVALARSFSNLLWPRFSEYVTTAEGGENDTLLRRKETRDIDRQVKRLIRGLPILKVEIHNLNGLTVYSSDPGEIGQTMQAGAQNLSSAHQGVPTSKLAFHKHFKGFLGEIADRDVVESRIPIWGDNNDIDGVVEIHTDVTPLMRVVKHRTDILTAGLLIAFTLLYLFLFRIVRNAERIVKETHAQLADKVEEYKRTENRMMQQSVLLKTTVEMMAQGFVVYDADQKLLASNERFSEILGFPPGFIRPGLTQEAVNRWRVKAGHFGHGDEEALLRERTSHLKVMTERSAERTLPDGTTYIYHRKPMPDGGVVITYTDITERKRAREELAQKSALLETTLDSMSHGIVVEDAEHRLLAFNQKSVELRDYPPGFIRLGMSAEEAYRYKAEHGYYGPGDVDALVAARMDNRNLQKSHRQERTRADGRVIAILREPMPGGGRVTTYTDITESKNAEKDLQLAKEQAELASSSKSKFLANMSHELRTPLNSIIGFSELMMKASFGPLGHEKYAEFAADVNASGHHLLSLINNILDLSKIEAGKFQLSEETFDVTGVIQPCLRLMNVQAESRGVVLAKEYSGPLPRLRADQGMLKQITLNLLSNAIKFTPEGGTVTLKMRAQPATGFVLQVIDTGIGVSPEDIPKILKPFIQVESTYSRKHQGTGLGLSLCKHLVELHGGTLDFQSEVGTGSIVTVRFPVDRLVTPEDRPENSVAVQTGRTAV